MSILLLIDKLLICFLSIIPIERVNKDMVHQLPLRYN